MSDCTDPVNLRLVFCTCSERNALRMAHVLVDEGVAACVNIMPKVTSVYRWEGKVCEGKEALLIIKTTQEQIKDLTQQILEIHEYSLPEILVTPISEEDSYPPYLSWVAQSVGNP
tara:strand:- start:129 stop:473 length:345 start_codon:yes stop_codon:yes gene_type:complete